MDMSVIDSRGIRACVGEWVRSESLSGSGSGNDSECGIGFLFSIFSILESRLELKLELELELEIKLELSVSSSTGTAATVCDKLELFNPFVFIAILPPSSSLSLSLSPSFPTLLFSIILSVI